MESTKATTIADETTTETTVVSSSSSPPSSSTRPLFQSEWPQQQQQTLQPKSHFEVYVANETFKFNAAHFVAFEGYRERLHGHNYRVGVRLLGNRTISSDGYLIDFGRIKEVTRQVCKRLNDHFLCPMLSNVLNISIITQSSSSSSSTTSSAFSPQQQQQQQQQQLSLVCQDGSQFSFPISDVAQLPIVHATSEEIAIYLWVEILKLLDSSYLVQRGIHTLEIIVTEAPGQEAVFRWPIPTSETDRSQTLDVRSFIISQGQVTPIPCLPSEDADKNNKDSSHKIGGGCCPQCSKSQFELTEKLDRLANAINQGNLTSSPGQKLTRQDLEALLN